MSRKEPIREPAVIKQSADDALIYAENIIDTVREPLIALDHDLIVIKASRSFYEFFKVKLEDTVGQHIYDLGNKQWDIPRLRELLETILPQKTTFDNYEVEHDFASIGRRTMLLNARQIQRVLGKEEIILLAIEDITERRQAEKLLAEKAGALLGASEEKYRLLVENINDVFYILDNQGNITYISLAVERFTKYKVGDLLGKPFTQIIYPDDLPGLLDSFNRLVSGHLEPWEFRVMDKDGNILFVRSSSKPIYKDGQITGFTALMVDITDRKKAEEALQVSEEKFRNVFDNSAIGKSITSLDGTVNVNQAMADMLGYAKEELSRFKWQDITYPEDIEKTNIHLEPLQAGREDTTRFINRYLKKDRSIIWADVNTVLQRDSNGRPLYYITNVMDITESKKREEALHLQAEIMRNVAEGVVLVRAADTVIVHANAKFESMFGYGHGELIGENISTINAPTDKTPEELADEIQNSLKETGIWQGEICNIKKDGTSFWCFANVTTFTHQEYGDVFVSTHTDITERKKAEESLRISENKFSHVFYGSPLPLSLTRVRDGVLVEVNDAWMETYGFTRSEAYGKTTAELGISTNPEEREHIYALLQEKDNLHDIEITGYRTKDNPTPIILANFNILEFGGEKYVLTSAQDVTEHLQAEQTLSASEARYRLLAEHTTDVIRLLDMDLRTTYLSPSAEKQRGFTLQEMVEMPLERQLTPESLRTAYAILLKEIPRVESDPGYNPVLTLDLEYYRKDGNTVWTESKFSVIRDEDGKPVSILAEARDISERRQAEEKLANSYESLKKTLNDAINTMVKIVETRDPYTAGHQQKVADLATAIAGEMKLEDARIDQLKTAAVIHDIGKIYVPSDILSKPGKLTDIEFSLIKTHAQAGFDIVKGMDFPCNVAKTVLQHHERLDGSGYPNSLKGEDILLEGKILAVADVVEAMASHRPYRPALGIDKALEEISKNKGRLYDPDVVDACLELFKSGRYEFKSV